MGKFVEWSNELSVGIEEIDAQHQVLVGLLNQVHEAIQQHQGMEAARSVVTKLGEYTRVHFAVEESLMRILHYPGYEAHKRKHDELIKQLAELHTKLDAGKAITFELTLFLKAWLTKHIMEVDKRYVPHFLARGIDPALSRKSWVEKLWDTMNRKL